MTEHNQYLWDNMGTVLSIITYQIGMQSILHNIFIKILLPSAVHEDQYVNIWYQPHVKWVII